MLNRFSAAMIAARHTGLVAQRETLESQTGKQAVGNANGWGAFERFQQVALNTAKPIVFAVSGLDT